MTNSEATLLGQMIMDSRQDHRMVRMDIAQVRQEMRWEFHHLTKKVVATMDKSRSTGPDITVTEKWIVRLATIGLPTLTFWITGSWEKALQMFFQLAK